MLVHGAPKVGKSWLGQSTPSPRLVLDAEGGSRSPWRMIDGVATRQRVISWDPVSEEPPEPGDWEVCHVAVHNFRTFEKAYTWLASGKHPFRSLVVDSLTELQKRARDEIAGDSVMTEREWGLLLTKMEHTVRNMRDLAFHRSHPLDAVILIALTKVVDGKYKPAIQGSLSVSLPGYVDVEGYMFVELDGQFQEHRKMLIAPRPEFEAGDRTHALTMRYGAGIESPDVEELLAVLNEEEK